MIRTIMSLSLALVLTATQTGEVRAAGMAEAEAALVAGDPDAAMEIYAALATDGAPAAQVALGELHDRWRDDPAEAARWYAMAAEQGYAPGQRSLAVLYIQGRGVDQSPRLAVRLLRTAADQGDAEAQMVLGDAYVRGYGGLGQDVAEGGRLLLLSAENGFALAQHRVAGHYREGALSPGSHVFLPNDAEAVRWYRVAAEQGFTDSQFELGLLLSQGIGAPQDDAQAARWYRAAAAGPAGGHPLAMLNLGFLIWTGRVEGGPAEAVELFRRAAERGVAQAQHNLGLAYDNGVGVARDAVEAARWYAAAAHQGLPLAQYNLGVSYATGDGVAQDAAEAARWFRAAAEQGVPEAQHSLAVLHSQGDGAPQSAEEAARLWRAAAEQGFALSQIELGNAYYEGRGVPQDHAEAMRWYLEAAKQDAPDAQYFLALGYANGEGVQQDLVRSHLLLAIAAANGHAEATDVLAQVAEMMTAEQIAEAQAGFADWRASK